MSHCALDYLTGLLKGFTMDGDLSGVRRIEAESGHVSKEVVQCVANGIPYVHYIPLHSVGSSKLARKTHVDMLSKVQIDLYASGLHKAGSTAVR